jgi:hypothetical protein
LPNRVSGVVFSARNSNGRQDPGEAPLRGYAVEVIGSNGRQTVTSGTAATPGFSFDNVADGSSPNVLLPAGATLTTPVDSDVRFVGVQELSGFGIAVPASVAFRAANLQGNRGIPDLAVNVGDTVYVRQVLQNGSTRLLTPPTGLQTSPDASSLEVIDLDGDGNLDLVAGGLGGVAVFFNQGFGLFNAAQTVLTGSSAVAWRLAVVPGGSGQLPTAYAAANSPSASLIPPRYDPIQPTREMVVVGTAIPTPYMVGDLVSGDFDGDGQVDLAVRDRRPARSSCAAARLSPGRSTRARRPAPRRRNWRWPTSSATAGGRSSTSIGPPTGLAATSACATTAPSRPVRSPSARA